MEHHCNAVTHLQATDEMCYRRTQTALYTSGSQCMAQKVFKITGWGACFFWCVRFSSRNNRFSFFKSCGLRLKSVVAAAFPWLTTLPVALILQGSLRLIPVGDILGWSESHVEFPLHLDTIPFGANQKAGVSVSGSRGKLLFCADTQCVASVGLAPLAGLGCWW